MPLDMDLLRKEYEDAIKQSSGSEYWTPKEASNLVRILPPKQGKKLFYKKVGIHFGLLGSRMEFCPMESANLRCPVCEAVSNLYKLNTPGSAQLIQTLKVKKRYLMNIVVLDNDTSTPVQYLAPITVYKDILGIIMDSDYGDITDGKAGRNIVIEKIVPGGQKIQTEYKVRAKPDKSALKDISVLDRLADLEELVKGKIKDADMLTIILLGSDGEEIESVDDLISKYAGRAEKKEEVMPVEQPTAKTDSKIEERIKGLFNK